MRILPWTKVACLLSAATFLSWEAGRCEAAVLINQPSQYPNSFNALTSQNEASGASYQSYDNFTLSGPGPFSIVSITWQGIYWNPQPGAPANPIAFSPPANTSPPLSENYFGVGFYTNTATNLPGTLLNPLPEAIQLKNLSFANVGTAGFGPNNIGGYDTVNVYNFSADLAVSSTFELAAGTYWLSLVWFAPDNSYPPVFLWTSGTGGDGISAQLAYGQPNAVYAPADRAFSLSTELAESALASEPPQNPPTGQLVDTPVPEPGSLTIMGTLLVVGGAGYVWRGRNRGA